MILLLLLSLCTETISRRTVSLLVALKGPIGGSLALTLPAALGQDPVEEAGRALRVGLWGH